MGGGGGNPDLFHSCCTNPFICGVPLNYHNLSFQYPHSGNSYVGIDAANSVHPDKGREYIQSKLNKGLSSGHNYCVKFYSSLSDQNLAYITTLGAYLDSGNVYASTYLGLAIATPQVYNNANPLNDTVNWMKIEGSFTATGIESYITIGNFFPDSTTGIGFFGSPTSWWVYYYIDDVSVIDVSLPAYASNDTLIQPGDSVFIGRQPEIGLDEDCIWFVNGLPIDTVAGLWVKPDSTTTYIVQQTICGNVQWDTVTVSVYGTGIGEGTNGLTRWLRVYPNPNNGTFNIELNSLNSSLLAEVSICNIVGTEIYKEQLEIKNGISSIKPLLDEGIYFLNIKEIKSLKTYSKKLVIIK